MLRGLFRAIFENAFVVFSLVAILSAFLYVVVYPAFASTGETTKNDSFFLESLLAELSASPTPSRAVTGVATVVVTGTVKSASTPTVKSIATVQARPTIATPTAGVGNPPLPSQSTVITKSGVSTPRATSTPPPKTPTVQTRLSTATATSSPTKTPTRQPVTATVTPTR